MANNSGGRGLARILEEKERQLQMFGTLGQRMLEQRIALEEAVARSADGDEEEGRRVEEMVKAWGEENEKSWGAVNGGNPLPTNASTTSLSSLPSPSSLPNGFDFPHQPLSASSSHSPEFDSLHLPDMDREGGRTMALQSNRRARNAQPREEMGQAFVNDISANLISEIRRLHALLNERDSKISDAHADLAAAQGTIAGLRAQIGRLETSEAKWSEENYEQQMKIQDIEKSHSEAVQGRQRAEAAEKRLGREARDARQEAEERKSEMEKLTRALEEQKTRHETEQARLRRQQAGLAREKSDLQAAVEAAKGEAEKERKKWGGRRGSPLVKSREGGVGEEEEGEEDVFGGGGPTRRNGGSLAANTSIPDLGPDVFADEDESGVSPPRTPRNAEADALRQSLSHAHRQIAMLKKAGRASPGMVLPEEAESWEDEETERERESAPSRGRGGRGRRGRARGGRVATLARAFQRQEEEEDEEPYPDGTTNSPAISLAGNGQSPSPPTSHSPGFDPSFLTPSPSPSPRPSSLPSSSPLRPTRGRGRGGAARPPSVIIPGGGSLGEELGEEWAELGGVERVEKECQVDVQELEPPVVVVPVVVEKGEMEVQTEPEPEPVPEPVVLKSEIATETEPEPQVVREEKEMSTDPLPEPLPLAPPLVIPIPELAPRSEAEIQTTPPTSPLTPAPTSPLTPLPTTPSALIQDFALTHDDSMTPRRPSTALSMGSPRPHAPRPDTALSTASTDADYEDALSVAATTPTRSVAEFYSLTGGDTSREHQLESSEEDEEEEEGGEETEYPRSDGGSFKPTTVPRLREASGGRRGPINAIYEPPEADALFEPPPPKPELKDAETQTDLPEEPPAVRVPETPTTDTRPEVQLPAGQKGLFMVGPKAQMTFVPALGSAPNGPPALALPVSESWNRDSVATIRPAGAVTLGRAASRRTPSIDSILSERNDSVPFPVPANHNRFSTAPSILSGTDKTRPPVMSLPPPPAAPPPSGIPARNKISSGPAPPRPTSPPPAELLQRAASPQFGHATLSIPTRHSRTPGSSMPPVLRQPPSIGSFRSSTAPATRPSVGSSLFPSTLETVAGSPSGPSKRANSQISLVSSSVSRRQSVSSVGSERVHFAPEALVPKQSHAPTTPAHNETAHGSDPAVINAITQTMIGEFLYKYNRRVVGKGYAEKRHKRFFWVHPYTHTLYWSNGDPGASSTNEQSSRSVFIESVKEVKDNNPHPPGLYHDSILVSTPQREMKFTAPTKERHDIWMNALRFLLARPSTVPINSPREAEHGSPSTPHGESHPRAESEAITSPKSQRTTRSEVTPEGWNVTPRQQRSQSQLSVGSSAKRVGTPAAEYLRWAESPSKPGSTSYHPLSPEELEFDTLDNFDETFEPNDDGFEGLENVRACCDGEHDVGMLSSRREDRFHNHTHHHHHQPNSNHTDLHPERPISPSGWSFRSRSSNQSNGGGFFSRGDGSIGRKGGLFGSRRSKTGKSPAVTQG